MEKTIVVKLASVFVFLEMMERRGKGMLDTSMGLYFANLKSHFLQGTPSHRKTNTVDPLILAIHLTLKVLVTTIDALGHF